MGVLTLMFVLTSPFLVLHLLPPSHTIQTVSGFSVVSNSGTNNVPAGTSSGTSNRTRTMETHNSTDIIARNSAIGSILEQLHLQNKEREMLMSVVCDGLQRLRECSGIPTFNDYMRNKGNYLLNQFSVSGRKKRFSNFDPWFGSSFNNFPTNSWPSGSWSSNTWPTNHHQETHTGDFGNNANAYVCPSVVDQSLVYQLSADSNNYPAVNIADELVANPSLAACLQNEIVLETDGPLLVVDNFRLTANSTCPYTQLRLWKYTSSGTNGECWVLQNFQENILYRTCTDQFCRNCVDKTTQATSWSANTINQKLCIPDYRQVSLWAFCPNSPNIPRIIRDRIIVPFACCCQSVACTVVPQWKK